jgi:ABC-type polysaccharide/polyol phosphate transport system ATPase subunit
VASPDQRIFHDEPAAGERPATPASLGQTTDQRLGASPYAIIVDDLFERFRISTDRPPTLKERLSTFRRAEYKAFEALKGVSLRIRHGESVALIGRNGSGKSTLLKCIAGILPADDGSVRVNGRIATLLELGAGFHPDLTGRENVYLNGAILGLRRAEIDESLDSIVEFAGVHEFIDNPVRNYSSGMYVRLGFAIAVHVDPDILLVDEVLSVGDATFQERSLARMRSFNQRGKTVVLVSHDLSAVGEMCERTLVLDQGNVVYDGRTENAIKFYQELIHTGTPAPEPHLDRIGDRNARITDVRLLVEGEQVDPAGDALPSGSTAQLAVSFEAEETVRDAGPLTVGIAVRRPDVQVYVYETRTDWRGIHLAPPRPGATGTVTFTLDLEVLTGDYLVDLLVANPASNAIHDRWQGAVRFRVASPIHEFGVARMDARIGIWNPEGYWPPEVAAPDLERGGPREHPLREDRPSPGYEPSMPRLQQDGTPPVSPAAP